MNENEKKQKISNRSIANAAENRYLCFNLAGDYYAIPLLQVKEVIGIPEFTPIPYVASHFCGIMNLRGQVISVIDLRKKLNVPANKGDENSVLVCLLDNIVMGALVDSVDFVINLDKKNIVLDVGCNDGSLLSKFKEKIDCITVGVDPTDAIKDAGTTIDFAVQGFFNSEVADKIANEIGTPDVITFTNVFAHIEDLPSLIKAIKSLLGN